MKAIVYRAYGTTDVLTLEEVPKPTPGDNEVLIKVRAAALNPLDWHLMRGVPWFLRLFTGLRKPRRTRLGVDVAGDVILTGPGVSDIKKGDSVFGAADGSFAEYVCAPVSALAIKPQNVTYERAAAVPIGGLTALQALRNKGNLQAGQKVLINGASGGVGTFAVQIAKWMGGKVTGVCSARNVNLVRGLGAERVVDYTSEDFTSSGESYDVIFDLVGNRPIAAFRSVLNPRGVFIGCGGGSPSTSASYLLAGMIGQLVMGWFTRQRLVGILAKRDKGDLEILRKLMTSGDVIPVIDRCYGLSELPEAIRYLEEGHARGKVVIAMPELS
ncbi:NAD(P)-dependent alcohol dehydrogenase [Telmatobacter sp. DSM 110680]|uniref:NAD(P)-dependent alcohol dehydrogenase n=1 Tax=Telmatobacter sp. DSM 110680 TaxID=3036704 RepID=A0AAU7DP15_9BACT